LAIRVPHGWPRATSDGLPIVIPLDAIRHVDLEQCRWWHKLRIRADARDYDGAVFTTFSAVQPLAHALIARGVTIEGTSGGADAG